MAKKKTKAQMAIIVAKRAATRKKNALAKDKVSFDINIHGLKPKPRYKKVATDGYQVIGVQLPNINKAYSYKADMDIEFKLNDRVVVKLPSGHLEIGKVVELEADRSRATKWIVQRVNLECYGEKCNIEARKAELRQAMETRLDEAKEEQRFREQAKKDPVMKGLLKEYESL